jgi:hypothetical protein
LDVHPRLLPEPADAPVALAGEADHALQHPKYKPRPPMAGGGGRLRLDLNRRVFQEVFFGLEADALKQVVAALKRLREFDWNSLYRHPGLRREAIEHVRGRAGAKGYSLRLSQRIRAVGHRDGDFLRLVSLHPDHDSAYDR